MAGAEDFFERVWDASKDRERIRRTIDSMRSREGVGGASLDSMPRGGFGNPMGKVDARIDFEVLTKSALEEAERTIGEARDLLFGVDGCSGLAKAFGSKYAEVLYLRYVDRLTIGGMSTLYGCAQNTVRDRVRVALDFIDSNGFEATRDGRNDVS